MNAKRYGWEKRGALTWNGNTYCIKKFRAISFRFKGWDTRNRASRIFWPLQVFNKKELEKLLRAKIKTAAICVDCWLGLKKGEPVYRGANITSENHINNKINI